MSETGHLDLIANRWAPFVYTIDFEGEDFNGALFAMQVRDRKDGGFLRADLANAADGTQGISLVGVTWTDGVPTSTVKIRIDKATMAAMKPATEIGEDAEAFWGLHVTPVGADEYVALEGSFIIKAGVVQNG